jgi:hypothetical protein
MKRTKKSVNYPTCDYQGECKNKAYREVYPSLMGSKHKGRGWSYLCRKHFYQEEKRLKHKMPCASIDPSYKHIVLRPEYADKLKKIKKRKGSCFKDINELRRACD